jgi:hypothetical protein
MHNEELHKLYPSLNTVRNIKLLSMKWAGMYHTWERGGAHTKFLVVKHEGKKPIGRP